MVIVLVASILEKTIGIKNFSENKLMMFLRGIFLLVVLTLFFLIENHLEMMNKKLIVLANQSLTEANAQNYLQQ